ncbi:MAG: hypothetical protein EZS28_016089, partial [Streblomastix strix]
MTRRGRRAAASDICERVPPELGDRSTGPGLNNRNTRRGTDERDNSSTGALGRAIWTRSITNRFLRGGTVRRANSRGQTTRKSSHGLGSRISRNEIAATVQIATGNTDIDSKARLVSNSEIQSVHVRKHIRHDLQGKHDASADGHDRAREPAENVTVTSNTSGIQQSNAEITAGVTSVRWSTSGLCRHVINENCRFYRRTGSRTEEADRAVSYRHDQE